MMEHLNEIKNYLPLIIAVGSIVIFLSGIAIRQWLLKEEVREHKSADESRFSELEKKYESLEAAFHNTQIQHGEQLATISTTMKFVTEMLTTLSNKLDLFISKK